MPSAALVQQPAPALIPEFFAKFFLGALGPDHQMTAVVARQIDAMSLVVGRDNQAEHVRHVETANVLVYTGQHIRRRRGIGFNPLIEGVAISAAAVAEIVRFIHPQDDGFGVRIVGAHQIRR
jgi:hypothetical protein